MPALARYGALALAALLVVPGAASAAVSNSYAVTGVEVAATATQGTFVGRGTGSAGDVSAWKAVVNHTTPLRPAATITGGSFRMTTVAPSGALDRVSGAFAQGGTIRLVGSDPGCGREFFSVSGPLAGVTTASGSSGTGLFAVVLTHYRVFLFGSCRTVAATVSGSVSFSF
jgi:hypothetical protein